MGLTCNDSACVSCSQVPSLTPACTNVSAQGTATANLTFNDDFAHYGPQLAVDGSSCTFYNSGNFPTDTTIGLTETWLQVDLGQTRTLNAMTLWLAMTPGGSVNLRLEYSSDGSTWQPEFTGVRSMNGHTPWLYGFADPKTARYFRVVFLASPSWVGVRELQLFDCGVAPVDAGPG